MLEEADALCNLLPAEYAGACVVTGRSELCQRSGFRQSDVATLVPKADGAA
jgi:hypothetical protein